MLENRDLPLESVEDILPEIRKVLTNLSTEGPGYPTDISWIEDFPDGSHNSIAAVDGGSSRSPINQGQVVFLVSSSLIERGESVKRARKYQAGILDDMGHIERISTCRETMEVKMALRTVESLDPELLLLDGSLEALVNRDIWATPFGARYGVQPIRWFLEELLIGFNEMGLDVTSGFNSLTLSHSNSEDIDHVIVEYYRTRVGRDPRRDELLRARIFLERYEMLVSLNKLLNKSRRLIAISKRSGSRIYFRSRAPDIEIVRRRFSLKEGYLRPISAELRFPEYYVIESSYPITVTYAKLERYANPLRIEVLGEHDESSVGRMLSSLAKSSVRGYPYHLRIAHEMAKIGRGELSYLLRNLGLVDWTSGREVLGE